MVLLNDSSTDADALEELFKNHVYGKSLATGQTWIDVGGHRGLFAILALMAGAKQVYSYEPHPGNAQVYSWNCRGWPATVRQQAIVADGTSRSTTLYVSRNPKDTWRHTMLPVRDRGRLHIESVATLDKLIRTHATADAIKLDCEGAELEILETVVFPMRIKTLVFEYSFSHDPSVPRFRKIISRLKASFKWVHYPPSAMRRPCVDGVYTKYKDRDVVVHCSR